MDGERVLAEAVEAYRAVLDDRLLAAYALGSLAHGGFSELVSDVDLGLIVRDPVQRADAETIQAVAEAEKAKESALQSRLSVFWGTPATLREEQSGGRFPALDRLDLIESGRLLLGSDAARRGLPRPTSVELIITGAEFALDHLARLHSPASLGYATLGSMRVAGEDAVEEIRNPELLVRRGVRRLTKLVLFPVRFLYTAMTGRVGTNDAAVEHYLTICEAPPSQLVAAARAWRTGALIEVGATSVLLRRQLVPLYLYYLDDHVARLANLERDDLAHAFESWRHRLVG